MRHFFERFIPKRYCSKLIGRLTRTRQKLIKNLLIKLYIKHYQVDMSSAENKTFNEYEHFNDFFTRRLKAGARPLSNGEHDLSCPVDGHISEFGEITRGRLFQAKGIDYPLQNLLAGRKDLANAFKQGFFLTFYLSAKDYHRVHMPVAGQLIEMSHVPGKLMPIHRQSIERVPELFSRNERVVSLFSTDWGPMAVVMIGSMFSGSISTVWAGDVACDNRGQISRNRYASQGLHSCCLKRGDELGHFNMGSTVIILLSDNDFTWSLNLKPHARVNMGECLLRLNPANRLHSIIYK